MYSDLFKHRTDPKVLSSSVQYTNTVYITLSFISQLFALQIILSA